MSFDALMFALALGLKVAAFGSIVLGLLCMKPPVRRWCRPATVSLLVGLWGAVIVSNLCALPWALPAFMTAAALWLLALVPPCHEWGVDPYTLMYPADV
jgi:hypothetical protein